MPSLSDLPEELLARIIDVLDLDPPSVANARNEPSLSFVHSNDSRLKNLASTSSQLRRIALPVLFKYVRFDIVKEWNNTIQKRGFRPEDLGPIHLFMEVVDDPNIDDLRRLLKAQDLDEDNSESPSTFEYKLSIYEGALQAPLLRFLKDNDLTSNVSSLLVFVNEGDLGESASDFLLSRYSGDRLISNLWSSLFTHIEPSRIAILAPLGRLACLTSCYFDGRFLDSFPDSYYQFLELHQDPLQLGKALPFHRADQWRIPANMRFAPASILRLRHWSKAGLNEGSFLGVYGTWDFFERGAPTRIKSMLNCLFPATFAEMRPCSDSMYTAHGLRRIDNFTYTAIFPFVKHVRGYADAQWHRFHHVRHLSVQFAPTRTDQSRILDDADRIGRAELPDCWSSVRRAYHQIGLRLLTNLTGSEPALRVLDCEDYSLEGLREDLDAAFSAMDSEMLHSGWEKNGKTWTRKVERLELGETAARIQQLDPR